MSIETLSSLSTINLVLLGAIAAVLIWLFLELLVAYSVESLVIGIIAYVVILARYPNLIPSTVAGYVLASGVGLFALMLGLYEYTLWKRSKRMKNVARRSLFRRGYSRPHGGRGSRW